MIPSTLRAIIALVIFASVSEFSWVCARKAS